MSADELGRAVDLLVGQVDHWEAPRWAAPGAAGATPRGEVMHALVQQIADRCADAEGEPRRRIPRLDNDLALPDQLRVVAADLAAADPGPETLAEAADRVRATRQAL